MNYQVIRRILDAVIILLLIVVLVPQGWFRQDNIIKPMLAEKLTKMEDEHTETASDTDYLALLDAQKAAQLARPDQSGASTMHKAVGQRKDDKTTNASKNQVVEKATPQAHTQAKSTDSLNTKAVTKTSGVNDQQHHEQVYLQLGVFKKPDAVQRVRSQIATIALPQSVVKKADKTFFYIGPIDRKYVKQNLDKLAKLGFFAIVVPQSSLVKS